MSVWVITDPWEQCSSQRARGKAHISRPFVVPPDNKEVVGKRLLERLPSPRETTLKEIQSDCNDTAEEDVSVYRQLLESCATTPFPPGEEVPNHLALPPQLAFTQATSDGGYWKAVQVQKRKKISHKKKEAKDRCSLSGRQRNGKIDKSIMKNNLSSGHNISAVSDSDMPIVDYIHAHLNDAVKKQSVVESIGSQRSSVRKAGSPRSVVGKTGSPRPLVGKTGSPRSVAGRTGSPRSVDGNTGSPLSVVRSTGSPRSVVGNTGSPQQQKDGSAHQELQQDTTVHFQQLIQTLYRELSRANIDKKSSGNRVTLLHASHGGTTAAPVGCLAYRQNHKTHKPLERALKHHSATYAVSKRQQRNKEASMQTLREFSLGEVQHQARRPAFMEDLMQKADNAPLPKITDERKTSELIEWGYRTPVDSK